ncbi:MAG: ATP-binding cassette domain-containing protein [Desulfatiglandales bacterium]
MSLKCSHLSFSYGPREVLSGVSFEVDRGLFCALLGRNGSGKTTLLYCLNGLLRPKGGTIELDGLDICRAKRRNIARRVSLVPQEHTEIFPFSVLDVVVMGRTAHLGFAERPGKAEYESALEILDLLKATDLAKRNFNRISGGERQIALLARALLQSSDTLLLDEPTNHLDFKNQYVFLDRIKGLCRLRGTRVIAAMHDPNMAGLFADQIVMIGDGRVLAEGPTAKVMDAMNVARLYDAEARRFDFPSGQRFFLPESICSRHGVENPSSPRIVIVSGAKHSGKSTLVGHFVESAVGHGYRVSGILAKGYWKDGLREGFDIVDLSDGSSVPLARRRRYEDPHEVTVFDFNREGIEAGVRALSPERCKRADIVILDEVGKLEALGRGWAPRIGPLLALDRPLYIWVVRSELLEKIQEIWNLQEPLVIRLDERDPLGRLESLACDALGPS